MYAALLGLALAASAPDTGALERIVLAIQAAEHAGDAATLERLTAADFVQHHSTGVEEPRAAWLVSRRTPAHLAGRSYLERDIRWRVAAGTAVRTSIARIRGAKPGIDLWVRSTAVLTHAGGAWQLLDLASATLFEGLAVEQPVTGLPLGAFAMADGAEVTIFERGGQVYLRQPGNREAPLISQSPDLFFAGIGSTLRVERSPDGGPAAITRRFGERLAWTARTSR